MMLRIIFAACSLSSPSLRARRPAAYHDEDLVSWINAPSTALNIYPADGSYRVSIQFMDFVSRSFALACNASCAVALHMLEISNSSWKKMHVLERDIVILRSTGSGVQSKLSTLMICLVRKTSSIYMQERSLPC